MSFVERKVSSTIEHRNCKAHEKRERLLISKVDFNFQISQQENNIPIDPFCSNWSNFIKKMSYKIFS